MLRIADRQQTQHHGMEQAEHGGVHADAECEDQHEDRRERRLAADHPHGVAEIAEEAFEFDLQRAACHWHFAHCTADGAPAESVILPKPSPCPLRWLSTRIPGSGL